MSSRSFGQLLFLAGILLLAVLLLILSLKSDGLGQGLRTQLRHCGVTGFLAFVGLLSVARICICQAGDGSCRTADEQSLYWKLKDIGVPKDH